MEVDKGIVAQLQALGYGVDKNWYPACAALGAPMGWCQACKAYEEIQGEKEENMFNDNEWLVAIKHKGVGLVLSIIEAPSDQEAAEKALNTPGFGDAVLVSRLSGNRGDAHGHYAARFERVPQPKAQKTDATVNLDF